ncbi:MAG: AAA family ATPase [Pseudomonadota bacterium]|nr:AAA family ATPase [Pseudomonadota bacterium]
MYESHFGLQEAPFALTPNTRYFLRAPSHGDALELLLVALSEREGFIKITGEVGTGKTLLCRLLLNELEQKAHTAYLPNPHLSPDALYQAVAEELGVEVAACTNTHQVLKALNERLIEMAMAQTPVVLVIDEAQAMPEATIEALRLLTNLETESTRLLQVVLFGQPELDAMLAQESLRQLRQRITFHYRLEPLDRHSVAQYLRHRVAQAGYNGGDLFSPGALRLITRASGGIPRLVNVLAHKAMLAAWGGGDRHIQRGHVARAIRDTESVRKPGLLARWL